MLKDCFSRAKENAKVKIHARMAAAYLNLGKPRMARIYTERVLHNIRKFDPCRLYPINC